jgi:hypothetical protein
MRHFALRWTMLVALVAILVPGGGVNPSAFAAGAGHHLHSLPSNAPVTVVAQGLNNPKGLAWGPNGHLLVSEGGTGGSECAGTDCFGLTGSISDISSGSPVRIVTGLASYSDNGPITGPDAVVSGSNGHLYALETKSSLFVPSGLSPGLTTELKKQLGAVLDVTDPQNISVIARPGDFDFTWSAQNKNNPDANPYHMIAGPQNGFYLVDAGANVLDSADQNGTVKVLAFIPPTPTGANSVPTCVAKGPDGALYIGQLAGAPSTATEASIYRYVPGTGELSVWQTGFSAITGCGFGAGGDFYVTEFNITGFPPAGPPMGAVIQIAPDGTRTVLGANELAAPNGFLAGSDGSIYVVNHTTSSGTGSPSGQVVKIG